MNVLFVNMPFSSIRPAIGVSLLKAHLEQIGVDATILYLNMRFARKLGFADYQYIAENTPSQALAGDWVFARSAFGEHDDADAAYLRMFGERFGKFPSTRRGLEVLVRARGMAGPFVEESLQDIDWPSFDVIGFTSTFTQHVASLALARRVKAKHPGAVIVFGGANCEAEMGLQVHRLFPFVDFVCSGEADRSFPRLVAALAAGEGGHGIPGVISRLDGNSHFRTLTPDRVEELDSLPYPDYDDYYGQYIRTFPAAKTPSPVLMESSRGCWWGEKHHCTFCGLNGTSMAFRSKSAQRVIMEMTTLCARYGARSVEMVDNILDMHYFNDLVPELARRKLQLGLFYETKANLTKEKLRALHSAGIHAIQPGIESFSTDVLRIMRKGTTAVQNVQLLKWCKETGINVLWNLIYGFPGESAGDYEVTGSIMDCIQHLQPPFGFSAIRLDRFSPNFTDAAAMGLVNVRVDRSYRCIYGLPDEQLFDLAYYFEYDYADGRDPETYVEYARKALGRWRRASDSRGLVYADHGELLAIWDFRPSAERTLTILEGHARALYLHCDQNRSLQQIHAYWHAQGASGEIQPILDGLVRARLMLRLDDRYLSLAVKCARGAPAVRRSGSTARAGEHVIL